MKQQNVVFYCSLAVWFKSGDQLPKMQALCRLCSLVQVLTISKSYCSPQKRLEDRFSVLANGLVYTVPLQDKLVVFGLF